MRLLLGLAILVALSFALPAAADTIRDDSRNGDTDDSGLVVTNLVQHDNDNAQGDEDNNDNAQGDEESNDDHDGFAGSGGTDSDAGDGPSNPTQNDSVANDPPVATPEPNALLLLGTGIAMAAAFRRKRSA